MSSESLCYAALLTFPDRAEAILDLLEPSRRSLALTTYGTLRDLSAVELRRRWRTLRSSELLALAAKQEG